MDAQLRSAGRRAALAAASFAAAFLFAGGAAHADGGDFSLDFAASEPSTYDHRFGGGAYDDHTVGVDIVESLEGGDFMCGELVTFLTGIEVEGAVSHPSQTIELDFSFLADTTGQPGAALADIANVQVNYGVVDSGDGPGGTDAGNADDGGSTATLVSEGLTGPLFTNGALLNGTVRVDDLEAGERLVLRLDTRIVCQPGSAPTGNLQGQLVAARVVEPASDAISAGAQTTSVKKIGELLFPALALQKTVTTADGSCPGQEILRIASGDAVKYCYEVANYGTQALLNLAAVDDNGTPLDPADDFTLTFAGLSDEDADGQADDLSPLATALAQASRSIALPVGGQVVNRATAHGDGLDPVWDVATVRVTDLPAGGCSVAVTASTDGTCPGSEVVNVLEGTDVRWCYAVSNGTAYDLTSVSLSDDGFGALGDVGPIAAGDSERTAHTAAAFDDQLHTGRASAVDVFGNARECTPDDAFANVVHPGVNIDKTVVENGGCPGADSLAVIVGHEVRYCYAVTNAGDTAAVNLSVGDDKLGAIGTIALLPAGASQTLVSAPVEILADVTNVATVSGSDQYGFPVFDQDAAIVDALAADIAVDKDGTQGVNRKLGNAVDYVLTVTNEGDIAAEDVVLSDPLPGLLLFGSAEPAGACSYDGTTVSCALGTLEPGESVSITIHGTVDVLFGRLDNRACATTSSPELDTADNCDDLVTKVAPGETRSQGFYGNHPQAVDLCLQASGGSIDLGFVVLADESSDDEIDATVGGDDDCAVETGLELTLGILNASNSRLNDGTRRSALDSARMSAARQAVTAWCNETLLETNGGLDWDAIRATLAGDSIAAINALQDLLNTFNLSGDLLPISLPIDLGPSDSSYPWDDPTDPVDPGDVMECPNTPQSPPTACGIGAELALVLPLILALRRRARRG
jgi:uncharacterized repeat protein (TIGR01451 family)